MTVDRRDVMVLDGRGSQLGVMVSDVDAKAAAGGVQIDEVNEDSPAEKAGIKAGDVVVEYDGERVRSARQFTRLVQETPEGRTVKIGLMRDGKKQTVDATPENSADDAGTSDPTSIGMREAERGLREFHFEMPDFDFRFDDRDDREPRRFEYRLPERHDAVHRRLARAARRDRAVADARARGILRREERRRAGVERGEGVGGGESRHQGRRRDHVDQRQGASSDSDDLIASSSDATGEATIVVLRDKKEMTLKAVIETTSSRSPESRPAARVTAGLQVERSAAASLLR